MTSSEIGEVLHFQQTDLIKAASENIDNMTIVGSALSEGIIELGLN